MLIIFHLLQNVNCSRSACKRNKQVRGNKEGEKITWSEGAWLLSLAVEKWWLLRLFFPCFLFLFLLCFSLFLLLCSFSLLSFFAHFPLFPLSLVSLFLFLLLSFPSFFPLCSPLFPSAFPPYVSLFLFFFVLLSLKSPQCSLNVFCHPSSPLSIFSSFFSSVRSLLSIISPSFFILFSPGPPLVFIRGRGRELGVSKKTEKPIKPRKPRKQ